MKEVLLNHDSAWLSLGAVFGCAFVVLLVLSVISKLLRQYAEKFPDWCRLNRCIETWWLMFAVALSAFWWGNTGINAVFLLISFFCLRECLGWVFRFGNNYCGALACFYVYLPCQYLFLQTQAYAQFSAFIVQYGWCFLVLALVSDEVVSGKVFAVRGLLMWLAVIVCVLLLSHVPAVMVLNIQDFRENILLLIFLMLVAQSSGIFQYLWHVVIGRNPIFTRFLPHQTVEGAVMGMISSIALAMLLSGMTPFSLWQAGAMGALIACMAFFGKLLVSAIQIMCWRNGYGDSLRVLAMMESLILSAPVFFWVVHGCWGMNPHGF